MTMYNVHIFREMRLRFDRIEARSSAEAARLAAAKLSAEAEEIEDCDGADFGALVDVEGDPDYRHSELIDFEPQQLARVWPSRRDLPWAFHDLQEALQQAALLPESERPVSDD